MALTPKELEDAFAKQDSMALADAVRFLSQSKQGRKYLWFLLSLGKVGAQPFSPDPYTTAFACGELNVGQRVLTHMLEVDPAIYTTLQQEQVNEYRSRTDRIERAHTAPGERDPSSELDFTSPSGYDN